MKPKFYYVFVIATCFLVILYACQKEQPGDQRDKKATISGARMTVPEARKYYNKLKAGQGNEVNMKALKVLSKQPNRKYILFEKAYTSETNAATFVEVPVLYNQRFGSVVNNTDGSGKPNLEEGREIFEASFDRLLIYRNKNTGKTDQRIITYIPRITYLRRHRGDISHNQINKLDKDFEGFIEYKKWDGTKLYLLEIKDGKTVNRTSLLKNGTRDTGSIGINSVTLLHYYR